MCKYFKIETDVAQNLIDDFFFYFWLSEDLSIERILSKKNAVVILQHAIFTMYLLVSQCIKLIRSSDQNHQNHHKFWSRCVVHEFSFTNFSNSINHGYRETTLKKNYLWLLPFFIAVAAYCYYDNVWRTKCN